MWVDAKGGLSALFFDVSRVLYGRAPYRRTPFLVVCDRGALAKEALRPFNGLPVRTFGSRCQIIDPQVLYGRARVCGMHRWIYAAERNRCARD